MAKDWNSIFNFRHIEFLHQMCSASWYPISAVLAKVHVDWACNKWLKNKKVLEKARAAGGSFVNSGLSLSWLTYWSIAVIKCVTAVIRDLIA